MFLTSSVIIIIGFIALTMLYEDGKLANQQYADTYATLQTKAARIEQLEYQLAGRDKMLERVLKDYLEEA